MPNERSDSSDQRDWQDKADPVESPEPTDRIDPTEPMLATDANEPTLPIDSTDPRGPAFGVAVLGTVLAAVYRSHLPAATPSAARRSLAAAVDLGPVLTEHARAAFDVALTRGPLIAAVCALAGAFVGWRALGTGTAASSTGASSAGNGTGTAVPQPAPTPAG